MGTSESKREIGHESGLRAVSRIPPRNMPTMRRTQFEAPASILEETSPPSTFSGRSKQKVWKRGWSAGGFGTRAVTLLNTFRLKRVENLEDGYDCLEGLVFTPTLKNVLVKYMDGLTTACTTHGKQAMSTSAEVETALAGTDTSDLRASFGHALSYSIPPLTLYCNYRPNAYSNLIFGVPLVNLTTNRDNVPKVIRMCIEEVEKRGLDTHKIYSVGSIYDANVLQANDIHSVAMLLRLYLGTSQSHCSCPLWKIVDNTEIIELDIPKMIAPYCDLRYVNYIQFTGHL
ncbi:hypothetical protein EDB84DRAFT_1442914 [Lactarius hengduanensis]|nr:hypothetical protein EDB84DRAFT_1442914 [Lactarius hengduanensis]